MRWKMEPSKRPPAFPLYAQDFISSLDVQMMSAAEVGAYCLLLFNSWAQPKQGYLPNDEAQLQFMSRLTPEQWKQSKKRLLGKFTITGDKKFRYNPRLIAELSKRAAYIEKQAENGKRGGRPRRGAQQPKPAASLGETQKNPTLSQPLEVANPNESFSTSTSFSTSFSEEPLPSVGGAGSGESEIEPWLAPIPESSTTTLRTPGGAADVGTLLVSEQGGRWQYDPAEIHPGLVLPFDNDDFREMWATYRRYREEKGLPRLSGGLQEQEALRNLANLAGGSQEKAHSIIAQAIRKGWKDLYKLDEQRPNPQQHAIGQSGGGQKPTGAAADIAARLVERRFQQRDGNTGAIGQAAGANSGFGSTVPSGFGTNP